MRRLASFPDERRAQVFCDALYADGIETTLRQNGETFDVWVHDERRMQDARIALEEFDTTEAPQKFAELAKHGRVQRTSEIEQLREMQRRTESLRAAMNRNAYPRLGHGTLALIVICIGFAILTRLGNDENLTLLFTFSDERHPATSGWNAIASGQVWRLITPAFLHFSMPAFMKYGPLHILFNLWWIKDLGTAIEYVDRTRTFLALVFTTIIVSHLTQVFFVGFVPFGGMSGVVYGLFGYIWIRGSLDPQWQLRVPSSIVMMLLLWLGLGLFSAEMSGGALLMANGVHIGGLLTGMVWGFFASGYLKRKLMF